MKNVKVIVFDVGNTLIDTKTSCKMSVKLLNDLHLLKNKGYIIGVSTLRNEEMIKPIIEDFKFDFLVLMNGSLVKINNIIISSNPLNKNIVENIFQTCKGLEIGVKVYLHNDIVYALKLINAKGKFIPQSDYQYYIWEHSGDIDITSKGVDKTYGIEVVCNNFGVNLSEVLAFGDGYNDLDLFRNVGYSVAMGDCPKELSMLADFTTYTAKKNGISYALREIGIL